MNKPFTLKLEELKNKIVEDINNAELPAFNVEIILQEIYKTIEELDKQEIEKYQREVQNEEKEEK